MNSLPLSDATRRASHMNRAERRAAKTSKPMRDYAEEWWRLKSLFAWKHVRDRGLWRYWENTITGERQVYCTGRGGYSAQPTRWLEGGTLEDDDQPPRPPFGLSGISNVVGSHRSAGEVKAGMNSEQIERNNPHTVRFPVQGTPAWQVTYWKDGIASGSKEATRAELALWSPGSGYYSFREFLLPIERDMLDRYNRTLLNIYARGKEDRSREFRLLLGLSKP